MRTSAICVALVGAAIGLVSPTASRADTYLLTSDHCTDGCGATTANPIGQVVVTGGSGTLNFTVTLFDGSKFMNGGQDVTIGFNLLGGPTITYSGVTAGFDVVGGNPQSAGTLHADGTGNFQYGLLWHLQGGANAVAGPLTFTITALGLTLASLIQNSDGQFFGVDILSGRTGFTGFVDASALVSQVPIPPAVLLFGSALIGMGLLGRRRKKGLAQAI